MTDCITLLRSRTRRLAKRITADGTIKAYDEARFFDLAEMPVADLDQLAGILRRLLPRPDIAIVRGVIADPDRTQAVRRLAFPDAATGYQPTLRESPHRWVALDLDAAPRPDDVPAADLAACARLAIATLPAEFHPARAIVQATASHGIKPGSRLRVWYWLDRAVTNAELKRWLRNAPVDRSAFTVAQLHYTAAPVLIDRLDHLPTRLAMLDGASAVLTPSAETLAPPPAPPPYRIPQGNQTAIQRAYTQALVRVATAPEGVRHNTLRNASRLVGGLIDQGGISTAEAAEALLAAILRAGGSAVDRQRAVQTIGWGLSAGQAAPITVEARR